MRGRGRKSATSAVGVESVSSAAIATGWGGKEEEILVLCVDSVDALCTSAASPSVAESALEDVRAISAKPAANQIESRRRAHACDENNTVVHFF